MRRLLVGLSVAVTCIAVRFAHADPSNASAASAPRFVPKLELELPLLKPLRFSFTSDPVPGFEMLRLGTYRAEALWWQRGSLSLLSYGQVAPALELDCLSTCQPMLERAAGVEGRFDLGGAGRALPASYLYLRGQSAQVISSLPGSRSPQRSNLLSLGLGGLLDF